MTEAEHQERKASEAAESHAVLRAKYLDYCSAQLADILLHLSPDEIYLVAAKAAKERGDSSAGSYMHMVQTATSWLSTRVSLPPFEVWIEDYRAHPERYEEQMMGLWESALEGGQDD